MADIGKMLRYLRNDYPPALRMRPSHPILSQGEVSVARVWPDPGDGLDGVLLGPGVDFSTMDDSLPVLLPGTYFPGLRPRDCFLHWLVPPECGHFPRRR